MTGVRDESLVGRTLNGRYKVGERIARGGMASVFMATDLRLDRVVAVKVMHQGLGDDAAFLQRFHREAKAAAKLNHRGVVSVFDQGADGDVTYLVMEYVPGSTLRDVMRTEAPMSPARSLDLLAGVLVALSAAHAAGIIHRDIKPENVLITPEGEVKVADFGLARAVSMDTAATGGQVMGTVSYLAPEVVSSQTADARADVYACGAMLYEMLTGSKPHTGETPIQVAYRHVHEDIGAPSASVPGIPTYVDALVARATERDPERRPADARGLLQLVRLVQRALEQGLTDDPALVADISAPEPVADEELTQPVATTMFPADGSGSAESTVAWSTGDAPRGRIVPAMSSDQYRQDKQNADGSKSGRTLLIATIAAALLVGFIGWYLGFGRYSNAPMLVGMSESSAASEAKAEGFTFRISSRDFSETAPLGTVVSTDPEPGGHILPGDVIQAVISKGKERYSVPELRNLAIADAIRKLHKAHLVPGNVTEGWSETVAKGKVRGSSGVAAGTPVRPGTKVSFVVSKGREPIQIRNYTGASRAGAIGGLRALGFGVAVVNGYSDTVSIGRVMGQSPSGGTGYRGDVIRITVSIGRATVKVPDVVGMRGSDATAAIEDAGLSSGGSGKGTVISQSPSGGTELKRGGTVSFDVQTAPDQPTCNRRKKRRGLC